jgi:hypothetical protein
LGFESAKTKEKEKEKKLRIIIVRRRGNEAYISTG